VGEIPSTSRKEFVPHVDMEQQQKCAPIHGLRKLTAQRLEQTNPSKGLQSTFV